MLFRNSPRLGLFLLGVHDLLFWTNSVGGLAFILGEIDLGFKFPDTIYLISFLLLFPLFCPADENGYNDRFCAEINGVRETRLYYTYPGGRSYVSVDCETATHVWEGGLDKRSSLDSIQQALFAAIITGKEPAVVIYDTDRVEGQYEHQIRVACERVGVYFRLYR